MISQIIFLIISFLIQGYYQDRFYVDGIGKDNPTYCRNITTPCKTPTYVINHYKPIGGLLSIVFLKGKFELNDVDITCNATLRTLEFFSKPPSSVSLTMDNVLINACTMHIQSIRFQLSKSAYSEPTSTRKQITIIKSSVFFRDVNFTNIQHQMNLIHSNLTMTNISYLFEDVLDKSSDIPLIYSVSSMEYYPNNFVSLKNWSLILVSNPLLVAYDCAVEVENIVISAHNAVKGHRFSKTSETPPSRSLITLYNTPKAVLNNITITRSNFVSNIIHLGDCAKSNVSISQISIIDCHVESTDDTFNSVFEIGSNNNVNLNDIKVRNTDVAMLINVLRNTNMKSMSDIEFEAKRPIYCESGFYFAKYSCLPCQLGSYQPDNKSQFTSCIACSPGTFANVSGLSMCHDCTNGTYCKDEGCVKCEFCYKQFSTSNQRATSCSVLHPFLYVASSVALAFILVPSLILMVKKLRKRYKKKKNQ